MKTKSVITFIKKTVKRRKAHGFTVVATVLAVICWLFLAQAFFMITSGSLSSIKAERDAYQAEQNAQLDVLRLKNLDYTELESKGAHARKTIEGVGDGNWESEVTLGSESSLTGGSGDKVRIARVNVFRKGDTVSRYSVDVPLTSQADGGGGVGLSYDYSRAYEKYWWRSRECIIDWIGGHHTFAYTLPENSLVMLHTSDEWGTAAYVNGGRAVPYFSTEYDHVQGGDGTAADYYRRGHHYMIFGRKGDVITGLCMGSSATIIPERKK